MHLGHCSSGGGKQGKLKTAEQIKVGWLMGGKAERNQKKGTDYGGGIKGMDASVQVDVWSSPPPPRPAT